MFSSANEVLRAAKTVADDALVIFQSACKPGVQANKPDSRFANNSTRWDAPQLCLNRAKAIRHEEIRLGRSMTPAEQDAHIRKLCE